MSDLWIPRSAEELEAAIEADTVVETHFHEYKRFSQSEADKPRVPKTLARSMAGLAVDGGVLVLGVEEDKHNQRFAAAPQRLLGLHEAVDQVALTALSPSLRVTVRELLREDGTGYLAVVVPASARAPHMVDGRYYGRGEVTSRQLTDTEVRELWQRHLDRRESAWDLLATEVEREPVVEELRTNARLFVVAQPVSADPRLLLDAVSGLDLLAWVQGLTNQSLYRAQREYAPTFAGQGNSQRRARGVARTNHYLESDRTVVVDGNRAVAASSIVDLEWHEDGGIRLYYGRASDFTSDNEHWLLLSAVIGEVAGVIHAARLVSETAGFYGSWRFGVALRGIRGIAAYGKDRWFQDNWKFSEDGYNETTEADDTLLNAAGSPVLDALVGRLVRSTKGVAEPIGVFDPFANPRDDEHA